MPDGDTSVVIDLISEGNTIITLSYDELGDTFAPYYTLGTAIVNDGGDVSIYSSTSKEFFTVFRTDGEIVTTDPTFGEILIDVTRFYGILYDNAVVFIASPELTNPKGSALSFVGDSSIFTFNKLVSGSFTGVGNYKRLYVGNDGVIQKTSSDTSLCLYTDSSVIATPKATASTSDYWFSNGTAIPISTSAPYLTISSIDSLSNQDEFKDWFYANFAYYSLT